MAKKKKVAIVMGSTSDTKYMKLTVEQLEAFGVPCDIRVLSAHRSPALAEAFARGAEAAGYGAVIAGAGAAAHLAGVIASMTTLPVIGVPLPGSHLGGVDALYATVQMPAGIPVATVAVGEAGAKNAAVLATQILALGDAALRRRLKKHKRDMEAKIRKAKVEL
jgi:phosphoribosylaminoimidazole carboxylase PurE protein